MTAFLNNQYKFNSASDMVLADNENQIYFTGQYYEKGQDEGHSAMESMISGKKPFSPIQGQEAVS